MNSTRFPDLALADWRETRDTLHLYTRFLGAIRKATMPRQKHWWHASLRVTATGFTTTPMPAGERTFELGLDLMNHLAYINTSEGDQWELVLEGQPLRIFSRDTLDALADLNIRPDVPRGDFADDEPREYDDLAVEDFWQVISQLDMLLKEFRGTLREETSPVQFWPHHFDLAMSWFSGRLVPDQDPADEEYADEQMAFGFSTGDATIPNPYFYVTAYPWQNALIDHALPADAAWHTQGWNGAVLPYSALRESEDPRALLLPYWHSALGAGRQLMWSP